MILNVFIDNKLLLNWNEVIQESSPKCLQFLRNFPSERISLCHKGYTGSNLIPKL